MSLRVERIRFDELDQRDALVSRADACVVEAALPEPVALRVAADILAGKLAVPSERRDHEAARSQVEAYGMGISPSGRYPQGPDPAAYFDAAPDFRVALRNLFSYDTDLFERLEAVLARLYSAPVRLAERADGRAFGSATIRQCPEGVGMTLHCENAYLDIPVTRELRESVRLELQWSWFFLLRAADAGGELELTDLSFGSRGALKPDAYPDACGAFERVLVEARVGDLVLFRSGDLHHRVLSPQKGCRITLGGFFAPARDGHGTRYWG